MTGLVFFAFLSGIVFDEAVTLVLGFLNARKNAREFEEWRKVHGISERGLRR